MLLSSLGEFGLIDRIAHVFKNRLPAGVIGIGDDCAVIPALPAALLTTDLMVEDVHFIRREIGPKNLGYKSLAVNISDIAACGGTPLYALLSIALPGNLEVEWLDLFFAGIEELAGPSRVALVGGDTTRSPGPITINLTLIGLAPPHGPKLRSSAKPGDVVCVTADMGDSAGGLKIILEGKARDAEARYLVDKHHRPRPQLEEGRWLAAQAQVHAMMDLSDGLESDLPHILKASGCGAEIHIEKLPVSMQLRETSNRHSWDEAALAFSGGEDYGLLVTVAPEAQERLGNELMERFGTPLHPIGAVTGRTGALTLYRHGEKIDLPQAGFRHFGGTTS